jgi:hypothetical protein
MKTTTVDRELALNECILQMKMGKMGERLRHREQGKKPRADL